MWRKCAGFAILAAFEPRSADQDCTCISAEPANLEAHATIWASWVECAVVVFAMSIGTHDCIVRPVFGPQRGSRFWSVSMAARPNQMISQRSAYSLGFLGNPTSAQYRPIWLSSLEVVRSMWLQRSLQTFRCGISVASRWTCQWKWIVYLWNQAAVICLPCIYMTRSPWRPTLLFLYKF